VERERREKMRAPGESKQSSLCKWTAVVIARKESWSWAPPILHGSSMRPSEEGLKKESISTCLMPRPEQECLNSKFKEFQTLWPSKTSLIWELPLSYTLVRISKLFRRRHCSCLSENAKMLQGSRYCLTVFTPHALLVTLKGKKWICMTSLQASWKSQTFA
jgi:hypothetical protein